MRFTWIFMLICSAGISANQLLASDQDHPVDKLESRLLAIESTFNSTEFSFENCARRSDEIFDELGRLDPPSYPRKDLEARAEPLVRASWQARLALRRRLVKFHGAGQSSEACTLAVRRAMRALRGVEDYVGHLEAAPGSALLSVVPNSPSDFPAAGTLMNPQVADTELRSGDVLVSRGNAITSAMIARMADEDTQFSHLALLYIDEKTREKFTIESHIEFGAVVIPFDEYFKDGKLRSAIFRYGDAAVAHLAAKRMFDKVGRRMRAGDNIPYDFNMNPRDHSKLFCSEVVREGFEAATGRKVIVPLYSSRFSMKNRDFLKRLGIREKASFIPADIEGDPRFELVGEWRDWEKIDAAWILDAVLTKMYEWMETRGYVFRDKPIHFVKKNLAWLIRRTPLLEKIVEKKFPRNMTRTVLATNFILTSVGEGILKELAPRMLQYERETGFPITITRLYRELDDVRAEDEARFVARRHWVKNPLSLLPARKPVFHRLFRGPPAPINAPDFMRYLVFHEDLRADPL